MKKQKTLIALAACFAVSLLHPARAADAVEKPNIAIGTASLGLTYLPLVIADRKGYFKQAGLTVEISGFPGGSKALEALMGGSVDVVSGAYSNTLTMAAKGQKLVEFVDQIRCPGFVLLVSKRRLPQYHGLQDLKGMNVGVSAPGSSTHMVLNYILKGAGLDSGDISVIGVGTSAGAVAAMRSGQIDALLNSDPVITILEQSGDAKAVVDTRTPAASDKVFGGPYPEASLYVKAEFAAHNPKTMQALTNAMLNAERWLQTATPDQIADAVPEEYLLGDRALYIKALGNMRTCLSPDGLLSHDAAATVLKVLSGLRRRREKRRYQAGDDL
ncbi:MAG: ABC transporter substrate-binding protein [Acetobacteraceae bacterium]